MMHSTFVSPCRFSFVFVVATIFFTSCATPSESPTANVPVAPLVVPSGGPLPVAFVIGEDAEVLDFAGPLEVFSCAWTEEGQPLFRPYFVAATREPVVVGGGMRIVPDYTFADAPAPKLVVIPAMTFDIPAAMIEWIARVAPETDLTLSVCNGAFILAKTGLLDGRRATAHHGAYFRFAATYPEVKLQRGARFVEDGKFASAGGITSGIDLALRVVERYLGRTRTEAIVLLMEYQGTGWRDAESNGAYARFGSEEGGRSLCPLCGMEGDPRIQSEFLGRTFFFCSSDEKTFFDTHPEIARRFLAEDEEAR